MRCPPRPAPWECPFSRQVAVTASSVSTHRITGSSCSRAPTRLGLPWHKSRRPPPSGATFGSCASTWKRIPSAVPRSSAAKAPPDRSISASAQASLGQWGTTLPARRALNRSRNFPTRTSWNASVASGRTSGRLWIHNANCAISRHGPDMTKQSHTDKNAIRDGPPLEN